MNPTPTYRFAGYQLEAQIGQTPKTSVYRARIEGQPHTAIIKVIRMANPSAEQLARFKYEFNLVRKLKIEGIVKPIELISENNIHALVLEDFGGIALKETIGAGVSIQRFLELAIRMADILGALHQNNVSHRDIKPSNILWNPEKDILKFTDFGISEIMPVQGVFAHSNLIEGTLAYISPEQTGRMNCTVDYRTDLYSLGITFYEMLTGTVPFRSTDPLALIHAHIAKSPAQLQDLNAAIPGPVSDIVMKLLSKSASQRYQNSLGLSADLKECLRQLQMTGRIEPFQLGTKDISPRLMIPQMIVGRDRELDALYSAFERVNRGPAEMILFCGEPGIGKSALVHELHKPIVAKRGYFLSGKFDQYLRSVPYLAIIQAFQNLIRQLLTESDEQLRTRKNQLLAALGTNGKIISDVIPEIEMIIGKQSEVPDLGPEETKNRFNLVFRNFVHIFAKAQHPLVVFLDDLQWADSASLNLIQTILSDGNLRHVLFIGAYRDMQVAPHHPLMLARETIEATGIAVRTIHLEPLDPEQVNRLIFTITECPPEISLSLARIICDKTNGIPFFIHQIIKTLYEKKYLRHDPSNGWTWNLDKIQSMPATENVVAFMAERLHELPAATLEILQLCACIGSQFDAKTLVSLTQHTISEIYTVIDTLLSAELIVRMGDIYRFYHDRIQEAADSLLSKNKREHLHYQIGSLELEQTSAQELDNRIFFICDHLNQALPCIKDRQERIRLAELNLTAGIKAKESTAYASAVSYLARGCGLLPEDAWKTDYKLTYQLFAEQMQCQYLDRNFQEAEQLFSILIAKAVSKADIAKAYAAMILLYTNVRPAKEAVKLGIQALKEVFGVRCRMDTGKVPVMLELLKVKRLLKKTGVENILDLPTLQDEALIAQHELMLNMTTAAYYVNPNLYALLSLMGVKVSLKHGLMPHSSLSFIALANILQATTGAYGLAFRIGEMALKLNERFDKLQFSGVLHHTFAFFIYHWKKPLKFELEIYPKAFELSASTGNFIFAGHSILASANSRLMMGHRLDEVMDELEKYDDFIPLVKDPLIILVQRHIKKSIRALKGETSFEDDISDSDKHIAQLKAEGNLFGMTLFLLRKMMLLVLFNRFEEAYPVAVMLDKYIHVPIGSILVAYHYFYYSVVLTALLEKGQGPARKYKALIRRNQRKLHKWATQCPENFQHHYDLIAAKLAGLKGRFYTAVRLYNAAISGARKNEFFTSEALSCEHLAVFYIGHNLRQEAGLFMQRAHDIYSVWGAAAKTDRMKAEHSSLFSGTHDASASQRMEDSTLSSETTSIQLDFSTVMRVSHLISSEIELDRLLAQVMQISIENAGAQRGYLLLESDGRLKIQASLTPESNETQVLQDIALEQCLGLSPAIVNYVFHSAKPVILDDATAESPFVNDPHIQEHQCKSILCIPIINKGKLMGILYMENNLTSQAFTPDRMEILRVIAAQAAISLQNAKLYNEITTEMAIRKQAEEAVRRSETKYQKILEEMEEGYYEIDLNGNFIVTNEAVLKMSGCSADDMTDMSYSDFLTAEEARIQYRLFNTIYKTGNPLKFHAYTVLRKDGTSSYAEISGYPLKNDENEIIGFWGITRDRTEQKHAEMALQKSEEQYRLLVENANDGIYITQEGYIKYHNPKTCEITGYTDEALSQMAFMDLVYPQDREMIHTDQKRRREKNQGPDVIAFRIVNKYEDMIWVELNAVDITWEGRPATLNFLRDVTQIKKTENRLQQAQKMEAIGTLAGGIAHDFNNILAAIMGYTELSLDDAYRGSRMEGHLKKVLTASQRAKELVRQILTFARQTEEKLEPIVVSIIAKEVLKLIRSSIPSTIDIQSDIRSNANIIGNPTQVHQIIMNLCTNAAHAMEKSGGVLTLNLVEHYIASNETNDLNMIQGKYLQLSVADTGCGIPPENLNSIFEPYFTTKCLGEGTGMGLSVVQGIVEKYCGKITVDSQVDKGTTFVVYLPVADTQVTLPTQDDKKLPTRNERVLFIDDEASIAEINAYILQRLGYQVTAQTDSLAALRLFNAQPEQFDIVITDMTMPNMTGDQLVEQILRTRPDIPVILCTGYSNRINEESALAMGVKAFIYKPIQKNELALTLRKVLDKAYTDRSFR